MYRVWNFIANYSILLISGALIALIWANINPNSYHHFVEFPLWFNDHVGLDYGYWAKSFGTGYDEFGGAGSLKVLSLHYLVNDMLMAFFFAIAAKEVWEAVILKNGSLRGKKAATPLFATLGGMLGPVSVYLVLAAVMGSDTYDAVANGWAIPTATDIAFSYLVGRLVFGAGHPAVRFLLLLAIADDAAGLIILAVFYPQGDLAPIWLMLSVGAAVTVYLLFNMLPRRLDVGKQLRPASTWVRNTLSFWPYLLAAGLSWYGFMRAGLHPSLGLLPIVPAIPHADRAFGLFSEALFFFGLLNAGVEFGAMGAATWLVLAGLLIGKPFGVLLFGWLGARVFRLGLPDGMRIIDLFVIGCIAAIGFTVALFIAVVAFEPGPVQDAAKMGALFSFAAAGISLVVGKLTNIERKDL